jgi:Glycine-zipper domain
MIAAVVPRRRKSMPAPRRSVVIVAAVALGSALGAVSVWAQQLFIYPQRGQSQQQQQQDRFECHQWAVQQTGFDPTVGSAPPPPTAAPTSGALRGAAGGAAIGAVGGAIGGNAGRGAAIGAGTGAVFGTMRRNSQIRQAEAQQTAHAQQANQQRDAYNRALAACLSGRGYTVQ